MRLSDVREVELAAGEAVGAISGVLAAREEWRIDPEEARILVGARLVLARVRSRARRMEGLESGTYKWVPGQLDPENVEVGPYVLSELKRMGIAQDVGPVPKFPGEPPTM